MGVLDLLIPSRCAGCGVPGNHCCAVCRLALAGRPWLAWPRPTPPGLPPPWAAAAYDGVTRALLIAYKERGAIGLARELAVPLAAALEAAMAGSREPVVLIPVPSTRRSVVNRGDDVVAVLCRRAAALARRSGGTVRVAPALRHARAVADSAGLTSAQRAANLSGALTVSSRASPALRGATVVLVDDLVTTGATIAEAARAVRETGAVVVGAATVAATQRRGIGAR